MTTAHRPTFDPARGKEALRGAGYHQRLQPAHTALKQRKAGQGGVGGLTSSTGGARPDRRDLRAELLKAEATVRARKEGRTGEEHAAITGSVHTKAEDGSDQEEEEDVAMKRRRLILEEAHDIDASSSSSSEDEGNTAPKAEADESDADPGSSSDSDDSESDLMRELAKVKAERAAARQAEEAERARKAEEEREIAIGRGNPLLNADEGDLGNEPRHFGVKRRWDEDVVFKNQARGTEERAKGRGKEFVNDLLRSDFHRKFMDKYVK